MSASKNKKREIKEHKDTQSLAEEEDMLVPPIKHRRRFSPEETHILEKEYDRNPNPTQEKIQHIANGIGTPRKIVTTWFQNRRAKNKRKEKLKSQENKSLIVSCISVTSDTEHHALDETGQNTNIKEIEMPLNGPTVLEVDAQTNSSALDDNSSSNFSPTTGPPPLLTSSYASPHLGHSSIPSNHSIFILPQSPSVVFSNNVFIQQQHPSSFHPFPSFEDTYKVDQSSLYPTNTSNKSPISSSIPFYRSSANVNNSTTSNPQICIKPTDLLIEYYNEERRYRESLLNVSNHHNNLIASSSTRNNMHGAINSTDNMSYEELLLMGSLDEPPKD
ncbi:hypothetical protein G6F62_002966 [Rhizopus arrhizus]|nr:hypothetical protein G6F23_000419 [Rhizopus arrhizus]KAG0767687.1 hypothetical protein G6F24_002574 [Rhizopus arrhizus]KAG0795970.1 hypothetical protein G6F21_001685 [Rhizopus arrhizus]KAG0801824.1 hypothetical protein G6F22_000865 [Rhizopus arrhizus]KAG0817425.1 hypothetical protein G6F20_002395 [Rhizopus arrhizus]